MTGRLVCLFPGRWEDASLIVRVECDEVIPPHAAGGHVVRVIRHDGDWTQWFLPTNAAAVEHADRIAAIVNGTGGMPNSKSSI